MPQTKPFGIEQAIGYLMTEQRYLKFDEDFLADPGVRSAILQAIQDAAGQVFSGELVDKYGQELSRSMEDKPNKDMPFNSHLKGAQKLIFEHVLQMNG